MSELRVLQPDDWPIWRDLRLKALTCDPTSFTTSAEAVRQRMDDEHFWRQRLSLEGSHNVVAERDGQPVGMVSAVLDGRGAAQISSMWVTPSLRGTGLADALLEAVVSWARLVGSDEVLLDVHEENRGEPKGSGRLPSPPLPSRRSLARERLPAHEPHSVTRSCWWSYARHRVVGAAANREHAPAMTEPRNCKAR